MGILGDPNEFNAEILYEGRRLNQTITKIYRNLLVVDNFKIIENEPALTA